MSIGQKPGSGFDNKNTVLGSAKTGFEIGKKRLLDKQKPGERQKRF